MTITNFRIPEKRKNKIEQELSDQQMDRMLQAEYLKNARALEEEAMEVPLNMPESQLLDDAQVILDQLLARIHEDPELEAIASAPVGEPKAAAMEDMAKKAVLRESVASGETDMEELIRLGRALKESGKTLEDILGEEADVAGESSGYVHARDEMAPTCQKRNSGRRFGRRARIFAGLAASLLIVFTVSMSSSAMRTFLIERLGWKFGDNPATAIDTDGELHFSEDREYSEVEALEVIKNDLGIASMYFSEKPDGMKYDDMYVDTNAMWAKMFYLYKDMVVTVIMDRSDEDMSMAVSYDGEKISEQVIELPLFATYAKVEKIQRDEEHTAFYAELQYGNAFYNVIGDMEEDVFLDLIQNITFG